jgi:hypothetical protein
MFTNRLVHESLACERRSSSREHPDPIFAQPMQAMKQLAPIRRTTSTHLARRRPNGARPWKFGPKVCCVHACCYPWLAVRIGIAAPLIGDALANYSSVAATRGRPVRIRVTVKRDRLCLHEARVPVQKKNVFRRNRPGPDDRTREIAT